MRGKLHRGGEGGRGSLSCVMYRVWMLVVRGVEVGGYAIMGH